MSEGTGDPTNAPETPPQKRYRVLYLSQSGRVEVTERLFAADDAEALAVAKARVNGHGVELWDGLRFVEHFKPPK